MANTTVEAQPRRRRARIRLTLLFAMLALIAVLAYLLSHSKTGNSGVVRDASTGQAPVVDRANPPKGASDGAIMVGIVDARLQGNPRDPSSLYCEIVASVRNMIDQEIHSLVLGIDYVAPNGDRASGNLNFGDIDSQTLRIRQHPISRLMDCHDLKAKVTVVDCTLGDLGVDCAPRVQPIRQGVVQLE
jgi:hypothetical protein